MERGRTRRSGSSLIKRLLVAVSVLFIGCVSITAIGYLLDSEMPGSYKLEHLGTIEEAAAVRKEAEGLLRDTVAAHHAWWEEQARKDPAWAAANPIRFEAEKDGEDGISIRCFPKMNEL